VAKGLIFSRDKASRAALSFFRTALGFLLTGSGFEFFILAGDGLLASEDDAAAQKGNPKLQKQTRAIIALDKAFLAFVCILRSRFDFSDERRLKRTHISIFVDPCGTHTTVWLIFNPISSRCVRL
jgi:uncharacterized membrane protein YidH (DUF202 family)